MKKIVFVFLLISQSLFSQTSNSKKTKKDLLQGVWGNSKQETSIIKFTENKFFFIKPGMESAKDTVVLNCNYKLKGKIITTDCPGYNYTIKKVTDSLLILKTKSNLFYLYKFPNG